MDSGFAIFLGVFAFAGLFIGWFFRNGLSILGLIVLVICSPVVALVSDLNWWPVTLSFLGGFLIHTWKPLYRKLQSL